MATFRSLFIVMLAALPLSGCFDGDDDSRDDPVQETSFTAFVAGLFDNTGVTAEPVPINNREFTFEDQDNPDAFNDILNQN